MYGIADVLLGVFQIRNEHYVTIVPAQVGDKLKDKMDPGEP